MGSISLFVIRRTDEDKTFALSLSLVCSCPHLCSFLFVLTLIPLSGDHGEPIFQHQTRFSDSATAIGSSFPRRWHQPEIESLLCPKSPGFLTVLSFLAPFISFTSFWELFSWLSPLFQPESAIRFYYPDSSITPCHLGLCVFLLLENHCFLFTLVVSSNAHSLFLAGSSFPESETDLKAVCLLLSFPLRCVLISHCHLLW